MEKIKLYDLMYNVNDDGKKIKSRITSIDEVDKKYNSYEIQTKNAEKMRSASDYAVACGIFSTKSELDKTYNGKQAVMYYVYNPNAKKRQYKYRYFMIDRIGMSYVSDKHFGVGVKPSILLNADAIATLNSNKKTKGMFNIKKVKSDEGKVLFRTLEFGQYPQSRVVDCENLEKAYKSNNLLKTKVKYPAYTTDDGEIVFGEEYFFENEKYVRLKTYSSNISKPKGTYENGDNFITSKEYQWFKVQPQTLIIDNWESLPKGINPRGNGKDKVIKLEMEEAIGACGISQLNNWLKLYDNSAFLNEINIKYKLPALCDDAPDTLKENKENEEDELCY